jgi:hypothetical protein
MTGPEGASPLGIDLYDALREAEIGLGPLPRNVRLLKDPAATQGRAVEFYSSLVGGSLLAIGRYAHDGQVHDRLAEQGLPVLPAYETGSEKVTLLRVPLGARTLGSLLHLLPRDIGMYSWFVRAVMQEQRAQYEAAQGVFSGANFSLVDRFAFVPDSTTEGGQRLFLVPPYDIDPQGTPETAGVHLVNELGMRGVEPQYLERLQEIIQREAVNGGA